MAVYNVEYSDGIWRVSIGEATSKPIRNGGKPVNAFLSGWHATNVYDGFAPIYLLELQHIDGSAATWYLDETMDRLAGNLDELTAEIRGHLAHKYLEVANSWRSLLETPQPTSAAANIGLAAINAGTLSALDRLSHEGISKNVISWIDISLATNAELSICVNSSSSKSFFQLSAEHVKSILSINLQEHFNFAQKNKALSWPSPFTGTPVTMVHCLYIDGMLNLYRCVEDDAKTIFYVCCAGHNMQTIGVLFPTVFRAFYLTSMQRHIAETLCDNLLERITAFIARFAQMLPKYFGQPLKTFIAPLWGGTAFHIGHHLWNDLSGLMRTVEMVPNDSLPRVAILGKQGDGEAYGDVDRLFPELAPYIVRGFENESQLVEFCCAERFQIIRITDSYVSKTLRNRIIGAIHSTPDIDQLSEVAEDLKQQNVTIAVLGLRVENRTLVDLEEFYLRIVEYLENRLGRVAIVIDGHNARVQNLGNRPPTFSSFTEARAAQPPIDLEKRIAHKLANAFKGGRVTILDNIGRTMNCSLFWLKHADFFIAPWGAGLAKYRWVANKPGIVVSSKWVLQNKGDLHIYDDPKYMESPSEMRFIEAKHVFDFADAPVLVQVFHPHHPMYFNFKVNMSALYKVIDNVIVALKNEKEKYRNQQ